MYMISLPFISPLSSLKSDQKDGATYAVISAHLQLQNSGFLSTWTNSFVGPWDPSQGVHNPGEDSKQCLSFSLLRYNFLMVK